MVSIFSTINETVYGQQQQRQQGSRKGSVVSISQPIKKKTCLDESHFINNYSPVNGQLKFYIVQKSYKSQNPKHLTLKRGTLVQLVSKENDGLCLVRLIREVGAGLVPFESLEEYSVLNGSLPVAHRSIYKPNQLMELTPPTSPSTLKSYVFSPASVSRGSSLSVSSSIASTPKEEEEENKRKVNSCEIVSIFMKDNRVHYTIRIKSASNKVKKEDRYYHDFYTLHASLIMENSKSPKIKLPWLPPPVSFKNNEVDNDTITDRISLFNNYMVELKKAVSSNKEYSNLEDIIQKWFMGDEEKTVIKVKVLFRKDYYVMKCSYGEISSYEKLQNYLKRKIESSNGKPSVVSDLHIKTKIDGWYIVNLSSDEIYNEILPEVKETKKLVLEVILQ
ncbi:similar to hypothetical protein KAFR_0B00710 [Kazachstania africana CBS 2517] [Maudiozyma barnettii]|uniref:PX domain-containing protein n=1 Tax=Maudiozyma barnettii TaxID=61262 RepID=A0A8H2ZHP1_9SACH|nr:similar to hypothetical protein KAFR_0B00710 [Kazachstania africana CBS 2517] [Kazachstania barnettii]CAB4254978.1 similar to hypothetical protein KAFR_0B00710 [Kazachstania africana CBS 2517] [Kazachstania barnettii]CAD1783249.1 similar to hypothetical protein KAFR_0B00710 [Kazachstania africana CBS 2517] [Kazachstania barnettii]